MDIRIRKPDLSSRAFTILLFQYTRSILGIVFFAVFGYGIMIWYESVYRGEWSDEERRVYSATAFKETVFREGDFDRAIGFAEERARQHDSRFSVKRDFFVPRSGR